MIQFECPECGSASAVPNSFAGRRETCVKCRATVVVPDPADAQSDPPETEATTRSREGDDDWRHQHLSVATPAAPVAVTPSSSLLQEQLERKARLSMTLGVSTFVLGGCCSAAMRNSAIEPGSSAHMAGQFAARVACISIPAVVGMVGVVLGVVALRGLSGRRSKAWLGLGLNGGYLLLFLLGFLSVFWPSGPRESGPPLTEAQLRTFAQEVERTIKQGDPKFLNARLDAEGLVRRAFPNASRWELRSAEAGVRKGATLGEEILQALEKGGDYSLLRLRLESPPRAVFRMVSSEGALNYHEYLLRRGAEGEVVYEDVYMLAGGLSLSEIMRRSILLQKAEQGKPGESLGEHYRGMLEPLKRGEHQKALDYYRGLPTKRQNQKEFLIYRLRAALAVGGSEYSAALEAIEDRLLADNPGVALLLIDRYLERGQFARCAEAIDAVDSAVGGDPVLDGLRGQLCVAEGNRVRARNKGYALVKKFPHLTTGYLVLLNLALTGNDFRWTADLLDRMEVRCQVRCDGLESRAGFERFVRSGEYRAWQERRARRPR